jgi:cytochrome c oxidase subunit 4
MGTERSMSITPTPHEARHPDAAEYIKIAVILTVLTSIEVAIWYIDALRPVLVYMLLALSAVKFTLVVGWYMHLKFDPPLFRRVFIFGLVVGLSVVLSFLVLFNRL